MDYVGVVLQEFYSKGVLYPGMSDAEHAAAEEKAYQIAGELEHTGAMAFTLEG